MSIRSAGNSGSCCCWEETRKKFTQLDKQSSCGRSKASMGVLKVVMPVDKRSSTNRDPQRDTEIGRNRGAKNKFESLNRNLGQNRHHSYCSIDKCTLDTVIAKTMHASNTSAATGRQWRASSGNQRSQTDTPSRLQPTARSDNN